MDRKEIKCLKCGLEKRITEFTKDKSRKSGLSKYCKECIAGLNRKYSLKNRERWRGCKRNYKLKAKKYREANREKYRAQCFANNLKRLGKIERGKCIICDKDRTEFHHEDYELTGIVISLCHWHHVRYHAYGEYAGYIKHVFRKKLAEKDCLFERKWKNGNHKSDRHRGSIRNGES